MLIDEATITVIGGHGGAGKVSFFPMKNGPDGGTGGKGGDVYVKVNPQLTSLYKFVQKREYKANPGKPGESNRRVGADAEDLILEVPPGTELKDLDTKQLIVLSTERAQVMLCRGGNGGLGNDAFKTATNQVPRHAELGEDGQTRHFRIVMKLIADVGFIGLPNAGKSSLLNELTAAHVKTANYPFTTIEPNLGALENKIIADIPGLIEGASSGKGLGIKFLKHIEKVKLVLHCVPSDSADIEKDYMTILEEMKKYNPVLLEKQEIVLLTKADLFPKEEIEKKVKLLKKYNKNVIPVSIHDFDGLEALKKILFDIK